MFGNNRIRWTAWGLILAVSLLVGASQAHSQDAKSLEKSWEDLIHYIKIAQTNAALSEAKYISSGQFQPEEIYDVAMATAGSREVLARGMRLEGLDAPLTDILKLIEQGYQQKRSDPEQIKRSVEMLGGTLEGYQLARRRLIESGEFALPVMFSYLMDAQTSDVLRTRLLTVLPDMGKEAVRGLSVVLQSQDPNLVKAAASALAQIEYPHAAPRLKEALMRDDLVADARETVRRALVAVAGPSALEKSVSEIFHTWAGNYYDKNESLMPDPRNPGIGHVWFWTEGLGLEMVPVPLEIFPDIYAMRFSRLALKYDPTFGSAVPLWVKAFARREVALPADAEDPLLKPDQLHARDYILATSPRYLQRALADALEEENSEVAFMLIEGLARTQGAKSLVATISGGAQPLVEALTYGDRRVRNLAAISLARALPTEPFSGYQLVMPVLTQALRQSGTKSAVLVGADNKLTSAVRAAGYEPIQGDDPDKAAAEALAVGGADVFIVNDPNDYARTRDLLQRQPILSQCPVVVVRGGSSLQRVAQDEPLLIVVGEVTDDAVKSALTEAAQTGVGRPMEADEANQWAIRTAGAIEKIAASGQDIYDAKLAVSALVSASGSDSDEVRTAASGALAAIDSSQAQRGVANLALAPDVSEPVRIEAFNDLSGSLRRFGNLLTDAQAEATVELVLSDASRDLRRAASKALGALNLPSEQIQKLILSRDVD
jgi:HEAT repeat protein